MNIIMAQVYNYVVFRNKMNISDDFGLRSPVIQKPFQRKRNHLYIGESALCEGERIPSSWENCVPPGALQIGQTDIVPDFGLSRKSQGIPGHCLLCLAFNHFWYIFHPIRLAVRTSTYTNLFICACGCGPLVSITVCVFFALHRSFYPPRSSRANPRADSSILLIERYVQVQWSQNTAKRLLKVVGCRLGNCCGTE